MATAKVTTKDSSIDFRAERWFIDNYRDGKEVVLSDEKQYEVKSTPGPQKPKISHSVYLENNSGGTFKIESKVKGVTINKCHDITVELDNVVGNVEIMNSQRVTIKAKGTVPIYQIDASETLSIQVSEAGVKVSPSFYTAKSTGTKITPDKGVEYSVPEQFVTSLKGDKFETHVVEVKLSNEEKEKHEVKVNLSEQQEVDLKKGTGVTLEVKGAAIHGLQNIGRGLLSVHLDSAVGNVEVKKAKKVQLRAKGAAKYWLEDNDRLSIKVSEADVKHSPTFYTAKSSSTNIIKTKKEEGSEEEVDDGEEYPVPEQFVTTLKSGKFETRVVVPGQE